MSTPEIKTLTPENIANEHICCAFADKKCQTGYQAKKEWLSHRFDQGYVFKKLDVRGKVFIEYGPAEKAWLPVEAPGYMLIGCFWVSGQYKGQGHGKALYEECLKDASGMNGVVIVAGKDKQPFMSDKKFFVHQGFELCDTADPYFELWYKPLVKSAPVPSFKACAKTAQCDVKQGISVYYSPACPFNDYYVNTELVRVADARGVPLSINRIETMEQAQQHTVPHTIYTVFVNGKFATQHILNEKNFDRFIKP